VFSRRFGAVTVGARSRARRTRRRAEPRGRGVSCGARGRCRWKAGHARVASIASGPRADHARVASFALGRRADHARVASIALGPRADHARVASFALGRRADHANEASIASGPRADHARVASIVFARMTDHANEASIVFGRKTKHACVASFESARRPSRWQRWRRRHRRLSLRPARRAGPSREALGTQTRAKPRRFPGLARSSCPNPSRFAALRLCARPSAEDPSAFARREADSDSRQSRSRNAPEAWARAPAPTLPASRLCASARVLLPTTPTPSRGAWQTESRADTPPLTRPSKLCARSRRRLRPRAERGRARSGST
jgi:hypothetical protein